MVFSASLYGVQIADFRLQIFLYFVGHSELQTFAHLCATWWITMSNTRFAGISLLVVLLCGCGSSPSGAASTPAPQLVATPPAMAPTTSAPTATRTDQNLSPTPTAVAQAAPGAEGNPMSKLDPTADAPQPAPRAPSGPNPRDRERQPSATIAGIPADARPAVDRARADLAQRAGISVEAVEVLAVRRQYRASGTSDSPGRTDGWQILLAAGDARYGYRVDAQGKLSRTSVSK